MPMVVQPGVVVGRVDRHRLRWPDVVIPRTTELVERAAAAQQLALAARAALQVAAEVVEAAGLDPAVAAPAAAGRRRTVPAVGGQLERRTTQVQGRDHARRCGEHLAVTVQTDRHAVDDAADVGHSRSRPQGQLPLAAVSRLVGSRLGIGTTTFARVRRKSVEGRPGRAPDLTSYCCARRADGPGRPSSCTSSATCSGWRMSGTRAS